jgi:hypothetical protein
MKKHALKALTTLSFLTALAVTTVFAQSPLPIRADVPFEFSVGNQTIAAGKCTVKRLSGTSTIVVEGDHRNVAAITMNTVASRDASKTKLVFHKYGNSYFLAQIWTEGSPDGIALVRSSAERKLIKSLKEQHLAMQEATPELVTVLVD